MGSDFARGRPQISLIVNIADNDQGNAPILGAHLRAVHLIEQVLLQRGRFRLRIEKMLPPRLGICGPRLRSRPLRVIFVPLIAELRLSGNSLGFWLTRTSRGSSSRVGFGFQLRRYKLPKLHQRRLQDMQALLHLWRKRLL